MRGFSCIGLESPKFAENVGGALRAAGCYGAAMVASSGQRFKSMATDTKKLYRHLPYLTVEDLRQAIPHLCVPVAVELVADATPLPDFDHPERAFYIFGPEDGCISDTVMEWVQRRVYVPTEGCMNLAATINVVLYDRLCKQNRAGG